MPSMVDAGAPTTKRSKFKERQAPEGELLADVRDSDIIDRPVTMPTRVTKSGFPSVHELDWKNLPKGPSHPHTAHTLTHSHPHKKKSLFSQQFENHSPEFFGFEFKSTNQVTVIERDTVEPFNIQPHSEATPTAAMPTAAEGGVSEFSSTASQAWTGLLDSAHSTLPGHTPLLSGVGGGAGGDGGSE